jgi:hypothetical protein
MYIRLYKEILNPLPQHRKAVKNGVEQKLKNLGFKYHSGNAYCECEFENMVELIRMFSWLKDLEFNTGEVGWI